jgi:hypothetical protein
VAVAVGDGLGIGVGVGLGVVVSIPARPNRTPNRRIPAKTATMSATQTLDTRSSM